MQFMPFRILMEFKMYWNGFLNLVKSKVVGVQLIIIDMRGNRGGDDTFGKKLSDLLAGTELKTPYGRQWTSQNPQSVQLFVNLFAYRIRKIKTKGNVVPKHLEALKNKFIDKRMDAIAGKIPKEKYDNWGSSRSMTNFDLNKSVKKPIYILMDANCASSCESTIDFFEFNPLVKTVGENTAGYIHFGNNGLVVLKNSGIKVNVAMSYSGYKDRRFLEKVGLTPQLKVPSGEDALEYAWRDYFREGNK